MLFQMACRSASRLQEEFHFHSGELDHVVILERVRRGADLLAIDGGPVGPFHMRDEVALRPAGQHRDPDPRLAERGERLGELELLEIGRAQRLNSSHLVISYAVFCLKKKKKKKRINSLTHRE